MGGVGALTATTTFVVTGPAGCGKSTVGVALAARLRWAFLEGDVRHPAANVAKMTAGQPLDDADRAPWLDGLAAWAGAREAAGDNAVLTCSALKRAYRDRLSDGHPSLRFVALQVPVAVLRERLIARRGHFLPASLLASQIAAWEPLGADEPGLTVDGTREVAEIVGDPALLALIRRSG